MFFLLILSKKKKTIRKQFLPKSDIYIREYKTKIIKKMSEAKGSASDIVISGQKYDDQSQITQTTQNSFQVNPSPKKRKEFFQQKKEK